MVTDPDELVDRPVDELRVALDDYDGDLEAALEAEKAGKDRKTAKEAIQDAMTEDGGRDAGMAAVKEAVQGEVETTEEGDTTTATDRFITTGVPGFDDLIDNGIPRGAPVLVSGGAGAGKTIFCLQTLAQHAAQGEKCFYMSFEEPEEALKQHMRDFGWDPDTLVEEGNLRIKRFSPFEVTRQVEAMLAEEKGELLIDVDPVLLPEGFEPDYVVIDSLTAIASAFSGEQESYRIYIEKLFRFFEERNATSFMISETQQDPEQFSPTGVEEFLADGVIVLYNIKQGNIRESAIEVLKMRGAKHEKKMVAMQIGDNGITVYPDQEVF